MARVFAILALLLLLAGCGPPVERVDVPEVPGSGLSMRFVIVSAQAFEWPGGYEGAVYVLRDTKTGAEYAAFFRAGGVSLQQIVGKVMVEDR